jgi:protein-glutamine gamma-glutamyltransferase
MPNWLNSLLGRRTQPVNLRDLEGAQRLANELYDGPVKLEDGPGGTSKSIDAGDRFVHGEPGNPMIEKLGPVRTEDLAFRAAVVKAGKDLAASGASFAGSASQDKVNEVLWTKGYGGKMQVRKWLAEGGTGKPSVALRDIFENGNKYGFECATAMMVIYHKAILDHVGDEAFDRLFTEPRNLKFFRWSIEDSDFTDVKRLAHVPSKLKPGSHYYYKNPDASEANSAFGGENVIYLGDGRFYAHGIRGASGTFEVTEAEILDTLTRLRKPGATEKPYRIDMEMHLDGLALSKKAVPDVTDLPL